MTSAPDGRAADPKVVEIDVGEGLGSPLSSEEAVERMREIVVRIPVAEWAGPVSGEVELAEALGIEIADLEAWKRDGLVVFFDDGAGGILHPVDQFVDGVPVSGLAEIVSSIGDPRVAWSWLVGPHAGLSRRRPLDVLKDRGSEALRSFVDRDFH